MVPPASFSEKEPPTHSSDGGKEKPKEVTISFSKLKVREEGVGSKGEDGTMRLMTKEKVFEIKDDSKTPPKNGSSNHGSNVAKIAIVGPTTTTTEPTGHSNNFEVGGTKIPSSTKNASTGMNEDGTFRLPNSEQWTGGDVCDRPISTGNAIPQAVVVPGGNPIIPSIAKRPPNGVGGGVAVLSPGKTGVSGAASMNTNNGENAASNSSGANTSDDVIDSALLSALSDQRERKGLLRLEQTLVDFMKERNAGYIEVGGPNNSIVINGQSGGARNVGDTSQDGVLPQQMQLVGDGQQYNAGGNGRGGRQTSFQRLCLHRLADRFNIVREPASTPLQASDGDGYSSGGVNNNGGGNVSYPPGLIRLVKVKNSRIPSKLLIDLDLSAYSTPSGNRGAGGGGRGLVNPDAIGNSDEQIRGGIPESLSSSSHGETTKSVQKPKKMMIMKRSSSGLGSSGSLKSKGDDYRKGGRNKGKGLKGKNLSDKEKAYEEARARIFNETQSSTSAGGGGTGDEALNQEGSDSVTPFETPPRTASPSSSRSSEAGVAVSDEQQISANGKSASPTHQKPQSQDAVDSSTSDLRIKRESPSPTSSSYQQQPVPAAAATGGAVSKVTWRNRRQEENDPDFRRRGTVRVPVSTGAVGLAGTPSNIAVVNHPMHYGGPPMASEPAPGNFQGIPTMIVQQPQQQQHVYSSQQSQQHYYATQANAAAPGGTTQPHRHQQNQQQVQAATAAYYAQQHAAAAFYAQSHQQQQQHHHRSHSPNVSGGSGQHTRHHHHMQQSRGTAGGVGGYGGGGGGSGQYAVHGGRHWGKHSSDVGSRGSRRAGADTNSQQPAATTAANVYNIEEFPALR